MQGCVLYMMFKKYGCLVLLFFPLMAEAWNWPVFCLHDYFISISGNAGWTNPGKTQTIALEPDVIKTYVPENLSNSRVLLSGELFLGVQKSYFPHIQSQFGLAFYFSDAAKLQGYIQEDGDFNFQNYAYAYKVDHKHIAFKTKWIYESNCYLNPYLSASIGVGVNRASHFGITPLIFQEVSAPPFQSATNTALSYSLGAGVQTNLNQHWAIALGYQFVSWGESQLNRADGQTSGHGLRLDNLYTQNLELNISYFL